MNYRNGIRVLRLTMFLPLLWSASHDNLSASPRKALSRMTTSTLPAAPDAPTTDTVDVYHGETIADPYRILENPDDPLTKKWVRGQNERSRAYFDQTRDYKRFLKRLKEVWDFERMDIPQREGELLYYERAKGLQNQFVLYKRDGLMGKSTLVLDPNTFSKDGTVALSSWSPSPDNRYLAYTVSSGGSDWNQAHVLDLKTMKKRADSLDWLKFTGLAWQPDSSGFYYGRYPKPETSGTAALRDENYFHKLYYHKTGTPQNQDVLICERPDNKEISFSPYVTDDGKYLIINVGRGTEPKDGIYYAELTKGVPTTGSVMRLIEQGTANHHYIGHAGRTFYVITDDGAPKKKVVAVDLDNPAKANWRTVIAETNDAIDEILMLRDEILVSRLHDAFSVVERYDLQGTSRGPLALPGVGSVSDLSGKQTGDEAFFAFTSFVQPSTIYRYTSSEGIAKTFFTPNVEFRSADYVSTQTFAVSKDGTRVPVFVTHRKVVVYDGSNPTRLYGYGGFGVNMTPGFYTSSIPWFERGGVLAVAVIRGGGEYGEEWHRNGRQHKKQNSFDDFSAAAQHLIDLKVTSPERLGIEGGSNGGLLVAAVALQNPKLVRAVAPAVGVLDMLRFHKFTIGWAWIPEYGTSEKVEDFAILRKYSPLHNVKPDSEYPAFLLLTGDHDDRVVPAHSFKFAATLQKAQSGPHPVLLSVDTRAGHGGGKPMNKALDERARQLAFFARELGLRD